MNTGFYDDLDTNFELALEMANQKFSHDELIDLLSNGNIPQKQIAALSLDCVNDENEANVLISNLTGCDGKIREAVALKIKFLLQEFPTIYTLFNQADIFADATIDINGNICRLVLDSVEILKQDRQFAKIYLAKIFSFVHDAFEKLDSFIFRDKKYVINKQIFKLYWCLEALKLFVQEMSLEELLPILEKAMQIQEYTIREKVAQIVNSLDKMELQDIKNRLQNDDNYYVRNAINAKQCFV